MVKVFDPLVFQLAAFQGAIFTEFALSENIKQVSDTSFTAQQMIISDSGVVDHVGETSKTIKQQGSD
jgi:hypothetical protein